MRWYAIASNPIVNPARILHVLIDWLSNTNTQMRWHDVPPSSVQCEWYDMQFLHDLQWWSYRMVWRRWMMPSMPSFWAYHSVSRFFWDSILTIDRRRQCFVKPAALANHVNRRTFRLLPLEAQGWWWCCCCIRQQEGRIYPSYCPHFLSVRCNPMCFSSCLLYDKVVKQINQRIRILWCFDVMSVITHHHIITYQQHQKQSTPHHLIFRRVPSYHTGFRLP